MWMVDVLDTIELIKGIVRENWERAKTTTDWEKRNMILKSTEKAVRWHVRGLFVSANVDQWGVKKKEGAFEDFAADMQRLDTELTELGNRINALSRKHGQLHKMTQPDLTEFEGRTN